MFTLPRACRAPPSRLTQPPRLSPSRQISCIYKPSGLQQYNTSVATFQVLTACNTPRQSDSQPTLLLCLFVVFCCVFFCKIRAPTWWRRRGGARVGRRQQWGERLLEKNKEPKTTNKHKRRVGWLSVCLSGRISRC